jgi:hypothetical protein
MVVRELTECIYDRLVNGGIDQAEVDRRVLRFIEEYIGEMVSRVKVLGSGLS